MLVLLNDGEALAIGPVEGQGERRRGQREQGEVSLSACGPELLAVDWLLDSLASVVGGVLGAVTRAVAAEKAGGVLRRHR